MVVREYFEILDGEYRLLHTTLERLQGAHFDIICSPDGSLLFRLLMKRAQLWIGVVKLEV